MNAQRRGCMGVLRCPVHDSLIYDDCRHDPQCLRRPPKSFSCCLSAQESAGDLDSASSPGSLAETRRQSSVLDAEILGSHSKNMPGAKELALANLKSMNGFVDVDDNDDAEDQDVLEEKSAPSQTCCLPTSTLVVRPGSSGSSSVGLPADPEVQNLR